MDHMLTNKELEALKAINEIPMNTGEMPSIRDLKNRMNYQTPRSAAVLIDNLVKKGFMRKKKDGSLQLIEASITSSPSELTVNIPLVGSVSCGIPILADDNL